MKPTYGLTISCVFGWLAGCGQAIIPGGNNGGNGGGNGSISLPQSVGRFVVEAGEEKQSKDILPQAQINSTGNLMLILEPGDVSFTSDDGVSGTLQVSVAFGEVSGFDRACAEPVDSYGPFTVTVNANSQVTRVVGQFEVAATTAPLLTRGSYTICVTFSSTIAGTVIINALTVQ